MANDLTYIGAVVLHAIRSAHRYGFQIMAATQIPSGTVYPALRRLEKAGLIRSQWEKPAIARAEQRPTRKYYQVTPEGESALIEAGKRYRFPEMAAAQKEADR
jgi:PadR family transcriptional regulator, regulatory protein PadR